MRATEFIHFLTCPTLDKHEYTHLEIFDEIIEKDSKGVERTRYRWKDRFKKLRRSCRSKK